MNRVVFAVGGTGGHIFPAMALAKSFKDKNVEIIFAGKGLKTSPYLSREFKSVYDVNSSEFSFKNPMKALKAIVQYIKGTKKALKLLKEKKPNLVICFGSFYSFPVVLAAYLLKVPYILYENNSTLGRINRLFAKHAKLCAYELFDLEKKGFGRFVKVTSPMHNTPIETVEKKAARKHFQLDENVFTLLIFGGSQGALSVNLAILRAMSILKELPFQVIHLIGKNTNLDEVKKTYQKLNILACVKEFEDNMALCYKASDLMLSRSGANTVFEQIAFEIPAIYVPLPWATDNHQFKNASFVQKKLQAATIILQKDFTPDTLLKVLTNYIENPKENENIKQRLQSFNKLSKHQDLKELITPFLNKEGMN